MVAGGGCGFCYKDPEGHKIDEASCPCGRGYLTKDGLFVNGQRVKEGRVAAKRDYEEHIKLCIKCRRGSHECFWADGPEDYNSFFVPGPGITLEVATTYNDTHGGPHGSVKRASFKVCPAWICALALLTPCCRDKKDFSSSPGWHIPR
jgi:hypothetical protein